VEVGVSESRPMLKSDAWYWLTKNGAQTRIVITLHIDKPLRKIILERWEIVVDNRAIAQYPLLPLLTGVIQSLELQGGQQYVGVDLEIPVDKVFDNMPNNLPVGAFVFTSNNL